MKLLNIKKVKFQTLLVIFILFMAVAVFAYLFFRKSTYVQVVVKVGEPNYVYQVWRSNPYNGDVYSWFSQLLKPGMVEKSGLGDQVAVLEKVFKYDSSPDTSNVYLTLNVKTTYSRGSGQYTFKGKPLLAGSQIELYLDQVLVNGTVTEVLKSDLAPTYHKIVVEAVIYPKNWVDTFVNTNGVPSYLADVLKVGDVVKDSQNRTVINILDKKVNNALMLTSDSSGHVRTINNPLLKDISYTIELNVTKVGGKYFLLGDVPVVVGTEVPIHTKTASIYPTITKIVSCDGVTPCE